MSLHLRYGMIMFIASEVMFFVAWFWAFFDASLFPSEASQYARAAFTGGVWPPKGIEVLDPFHLPLYNTIILLLSGTTVTWAHHALLHDDRKGLINGLALTVGLGILFSFVQAYEYIHAPFALQGLASTARPSSWRPASTASTSSSARSSCCVCLIRAMKGDFTPKQHFGFEAAAWYWHFVDVVWLFLFASIYVWASVGASDRALGALIGMRNRKAAAATRPPCLLRPRLRAGPRRRSRMTQRMNDDQAIWPPVDPIAAGLQGPLPALRRGPAVLRLPDGGAALRRPAASTIPSPTPATARRSSSS